MTVDMKNIAFALMVMVTTGCATLTEEAMTPIAFSFSDGTAGTCELVNKRGAWSADIPSVVSVRKSDDALKYQCETKDGRRAIGALESEMGAKIVASAVFIDFGITDAITDKHRKYVDSYVIPVAPIEIDNEAAAESASDSDSSGKTDSYGKLRELEQLRQDGIITDEEFEAEKKEVLDSN